MNPFDQSILSFLSRFTHRSEVFDGVVFTVMNSGLLKGGVMMAILWWIWFSSGEEGTLNRQVIIATLIAAFASLFFAKTIEYLLPPRPRPVNSAAVNFLAPCYMTPSEIQHWLQSSFPSDHLALFSTFAIALYYVSRRLGLLVTLYVLIMVAFPRVYNGVHYPTDILGGCILGGSTAVFFNVPLIRQWVSSPFMALAERRPGIFYPFFFLVSYEVTVLLADLRVIGHVIYAAFK